MHLIAQTYKEDSLLSMPREQILLKLYDGVLLRLRTARNRIESGSRAEAGQAVTQALSIVAALREALDRSVPADALPRLDELYETVSHWLIEANVHQSVESIDSCLQILGTLKEGWDGAVQQLS